MTREGHVNNIISFHKDLSWNRNKWSNHQYFECLKLFPRTKTVDNYRNSDHISRADPGGKNLRQARTREVTISKCLCLNLHPSGPVFLNQIGIFNLLLWRRFQKRKTSGKIIILALCTHTNREKLHSKKSPTVTWLGCIKPILYLVQPRANSFSWFFCLNGYICPLLLTNPVIDPIKRTPC